MHRRRFLALTALSGASLAGCLDGLGDSEQEDQGNHTLDLEEYETVELVVGELYEGERHSLAIEDFVRDFGAVWDDESVGDDESFWENETVGDDEAIGADETLVGVQLAVKNVTDEFRSDYGWTTSWDEEKYEDLGNSGAKLYDGSDESYPTYPYHDSTYTDFLDRQLAPGEVGRGYLAYAIPEDTTALRLEIRNVLEAETTALAGFPNVATFVVDLDDTADTDSRIEQALQIDPAALGESIERNGLRVTPSNLRFQSSLAGDIEPTESTEFAVLDVAVHNGTGSQREIAAFDSQCKDGDGWTYHPTHLPQEAEVDDLETADPLIEAETRSGTLAFQVDSSTSPLYFVFRFQWEDEQRKGIWQLN